MVLSGCSSAISFNTSLRRATSQNASTLGYCAMMAFMYSLPSPLEAPVITAVTMDASPLFHFRILNQFYAIVIPPSIADCRKDEK